MRTQNKKNPPESLLERVSLSHGTIRAIEVTSKKVSDFKEKSREEIREIENNSGLSREEIKEARSISGILLRIDELFIKIDALREKFQTLLITHHPEDENTLDIRESYECDARDFSLILSEKIEAGKISLEEMIIALDHFFKLLNEGHQEKITRFMQSI